MALCGKCTPPTHCGAYLSVDCKHHVTTLGYKYCTLCASSGNRCEACGVPFPTRPLPSVTRFSASGRAQPPQPVQGSARPTPLGQPPSSIREGGK